MRHFLADWKSWSAAERFIALALIASTCLALAGPLFI
jgi:hypothetical protein